ncbi:MAG: prephenate dehydrogenase/arogenate dehydrogenase family protein, partial [Omnitrophica WOR_2 bacterium]
MPDNAAEEGFLKDQRIVIVGLGLMGGSLALALQGRCKALYGIDADPETADLARERQVVERASTGPGELLPLADLVVLAAPVRQILAILTQ